MTDWAWCGRVAVSSSGEVRRVMAAPELAVWYLGLPSSALVWTWQGGGVELLALAEARPFERWSGRIGQGSLLSLRARRGAEVRDASALLPWLDVPEDVPDDVRAAELLRLVLEAVADLEGRGYRMRSSRSLRLTIGAVAWATACELAGVPTSEPLEWGEYDAGRRSYYGGRCEVGQVEAPSVEGWDISGAYPWALLQPVPVGRRTVAVGPLARRAYEAGAGGCYFAKVEQPRDGLARLPFRHRPKTGRGRHRGPLLWVTGHVEGWWCAEELAAAEDTGARVEVGVAMLWEAFEPRWAPYLEHTGRDRAELRASGRDEVSAKLLANALSGKLAQGPDATTVRVLATGERPELGWSWHGARVWSKAHRHVPACARPIEAATVTARVRVVLLRELLRTRDAWCYCDTDSLWLVSGTAPPSREAAPWHPVDHGTEWHAPAPKTYRYRSSAGELVTRASGVPIGLRETMRAFARGEPSLPRAHPHMPPMPAGVQQWVGMRHINSGGRTAPLHRNQQGDIET